MSLVKFKTSRNPYFNHFSPMWDGLLQTAFPDMRGSEFTSLVPAVNITEHADAFHVAVAAPGLSKENFSISVSHNQLTVKGTQTSQTSNEAGAANGEQQPAETTTSKVRFLRREFAYGEFERSFSLPNTVNSEAITASYDNGILNVRIPKREEARTKEPRTIEIQ